MNIIKLSNRICALFAIILSCCIVQPAFATNPVMHKTVLAGHTIIVIGLTAVDADCGPTDPGEIRILQQPAHGTVSLVQADSFPNYPPLNPRHVCNTTKVPGIQLKYTAAADFAGEDVMSIEIFTPNGGDSNEVKVFLTVK